MVLPQGAGYSHPTKLAVRTRLDVLVQPRRVLRGRSGRRHRGGQLMTGNDREQIGRFLDRCSLCQSIVESKQVDSVMQ